METKRKHVKQSAYWKFAFLFLFLFFRFKQAFNYCIFLFFLFFRFKQAFNYCIFLFFSFFCNFWCQLIHHSVRRTGAHQETDSAFSAFPFPLYTADCQKSLPENTPIRNFADSALTDWTSQWRWRLPRPTASEFVDRCDENYLQLNYGKGNNDWFLGGPHQRV